MKWILYILFVFDLSVYGQGITPATSGIIASQVQNCDADAAAFITAAGITDATEKAALCQLVVDLKAYSLWTKMKAIYPMVGGTATTCKYNLKDPQDTDGAFRLTFSGGWTYSSTGALPNGTNSKADTHLVPNTSLTTTSGAFGYYSRTSGNTGANQIEMASIDANGQQLLAIRYLSLVGLLTWYQVPGGIPAYASSDYTGWFMNSRNGGTNTDAYIDGTRVAQQAQTAGLSQISMYIGCYHSPDSDYSGKECAMATISDGLSTTEAANLYTAIQAFQTTLGRQI